jgi:TRAP transporter TAXI family solute receptor
MRERMTAIALGFVGIALAAFMAYSFLAPTTLRIAVGPMAGNDTKVMVSFMQALQREKSNIRLKLVLTEGASTSAKAIEEGKADLAVVRSDINVPQDSATVAILRSEAIYFVTRPGLKIRKIADLKGRTVGAISPRPANDLILTRVLAHHNLTPDDLVMTRGSLSEIAQAVQEGRLDAVFVVATPTDRMGRLGFQDFPKMDGKEAEFLPIAGAEALAAQSPMFESIEIVRGTFGGDPPRPDEATHTLGVTFRLVVRRTLDEVVVSDLTRLLFALRLVIASETPAANQITLPSTENRSAKLPIHPGTIAYIEGETKTFFERYGDWVYVAIMALSFAGSVVAAFWSRITGGRTPIDLDKDLRELARLIEATRKAETSEELGEIRREADIVHTELVQAMALEEPDGDRVATIRFLIDELRFLQADKRAQLA